MYETKTIEATTTDGSKMALVVPVDIPSNDQAEYLRGIYKAHVGHPQGHWKGQAVAIVTESLVTDVAEAMDFMGSIVDERTVNDDGTVRLYSAGYWAHGF